MNLDFGTVADPDHGVVFADASDFAEINIKQLNLIQDDLNEQLDRLADRVENIVSLYIAARKKEAGEIDEPDNSTCANVQASDAA